MDAIITGTADLSAKKPNLVMVTRPRIGIGISAASSITPRVNVSGLWNRMVRNRMVQGNTDPCQDLYSQAEKRTDFADFLKQ